jgi:hypothetical protein
VTPLLHNLDGSNFDTFDILAIEPLQDLANGTIKDYEEGHNGDNSDDGPGKYYHVDRPYKLSPHNTSPRSVTPVVGISILGIMVVQI